MAQSAEQRIEPESTPLVAPAHSGKDTLAGPVFQRVLCAVDGARRSYAAVDQAAQLAGAGGNLTLLAVTAAKGGGRFRSAAISSMRAGKVMDRASRIATQAGVSFTCVVDPGAPPAKVIAQRAREQDLLVIGAPARSALGAIGGSVAIETLRTFTTPLLLARATAHERPLTETIVVASDGSDGSDALVALAARLAGEACRRIILVHAQGGESHAHPHRISAQKDLLQRECGERTQVLIEPRDAVQLIEDAVSSNGATLTVLGSRRVSGIGAMLGSVSRRAVRSLHCSVLVIPPESLHQ
jgi:nucleotide-binding universal stress UspA family protein